jgi:hypothetical protein
MISVILAAFPHDLMALLPILSYNYTRAKRVVFVVTGPLILLKWLSIYLRALQWPTHLTFRVGQPLQQCLLTDLDSLYQKGITVKLQ